MQAQHELNSREDLVTFLISQPEGVHLSEVKDTYKGIMEDIDKLRAANRILAWKHHDTE